MNSDKILTIIKEKNKKEIIHMLETIGKIKTLSFFAEVLSKRTYFTLNNDGTIKRNELDFILPIFAFSNDLDYLADSIINFSIFKSLGSFTRSFSVVIMKDACILSALF